jgi:hypothetical protein
MKLRFPHLRFALGQLSKELPRHPLARDALFPVRLRPEKVLPQDAFDHLDSGEPEATASEKQKSQTLRSL